MFVKSNNLKVLKDVYLSVCFFLLYTAYNTQSHIQKTLTVSIHEGNADYSVDGYVSLGIIFSVTSIFSWIGPWIISIFGLKEALITGAVCFLPFASACYIENSLYSYLSSGINGVGGAILWIAQAQYIISNSEVGRVYESIGIFWIFYKCSYLLGDALVYFEFNDSNVSIDKTMRARITILLVAFILSSIVMFSLLPLPQSKTAARVVNKCNPFSQLTNLYHSVFNVGQFAATCELCLYIGLHAAFLNIIAACLGFSNYLSANSKKFAPLSGFLQGIGEISGSLWSLYLKDRSKYPGRIFFITGSVANMIAYIIIFLGLPNDSVFDYTQQLPIIQLPIILFLMANVLVGLGDSCIQIETYQQVAQLFPKEDAPSAFAVLNCLTWITIATPYFYSTSLGLHLQMIILIIFLIFTTVVQHISFARNICPDETNEITANNKHRKSSNYNATVFKS